MPRLSQLSLPPLSDSAETLGQRIARIRKSRGKTQLQLAESIGVSRDLIANYEKDRARIYDEMIARIALALRISADELLGIKDLPASETQPINPNLVKRFRSIQSLSPFQQKSLLLTIDNFLKGAGVSSSQEVDS